MKTPSTKTTTKAKKKSSPRKVELASTIEAAAAAAEIPTRASMLKQLRKGTCKVNFLKANGRVRNLVCTLDEGILSHKPSYSSDEITQSKEILTVYDIEDGGTLRSFRIDSVRRFKAQLES